MKTIARFILLVALTGTIQGCSYTTYKTSIIINGDSNAMDTMQAFVDPNADFEF